MKPADVFPILNDVAPALWPHYRPAYRAKMGELGISPDTPDGFLLAVSHDYEPEPGTAAKFAHRNPYTSPHVTVDGLASLAERGLLESTGDGEYHLNESGRHIVDSLSAVLARELGKLEPLPAADLDRTARLLRRIVDAALAADEPADISCLRYNRGSDPGPDGPVLLQILQYLADLNSFRDDAHLAAWYPLNVSGPAWEALTFVWRDEAHTAAELVEKLPFRQIDAAGYTAALDELAARGWISAGDDGYRVTESGTAVRQQAEDTTERYYFAAWSALDEAEVAELGDLLGRLLTRLTETQPAEETAA